MFHLRFRSCFSFAVLALLLIFACQPATGMLKKIVGTFGPIASRLKSVPLTGRTSARPHLFNLGQRGFSDTNERNDASVRTQTQQQQLSSPLQNQQLQSHLQNQQLQSHLQNQQLQSHLQNQRSVDSPLANLLSNVPQPSNTPLVSESDDDDSSNEEEPQGKVGGIYSYKMGDMDVDKVCDCAQKGEVWKIGMSTNLEQRLGNAARKTAGLSGVQTEWISDSDTIAELFANSQSSSPIPMLKVPGTSKDIKAKEKELHDAIVDVPGVVRLDRSQAINFLMTQCKLDQSSATSRLKKIGALTELFFVDKQVINNIQSMIQTCGIKGTKDFSVDCIIEGLKKMHK